MRFQYGLEGVVTVVGKVRCGLLWLVVSPAGCGQGYKKSVSGTGGGGIVFRRLCEVLAQSRSSDLHRQVQFLKAENGVLRSGIKDPIRTSRAERDRLIKLGTSLRPAIKEIISIVKPKTFAKWLRLKRPLIRIRKRTQGRPRKPQDVRKLVVRLARETSWGYTRLVGELKKLGHRLSKSTIKNILKEAGIPTSPRRDETTWDQFLKAHAKTLWACDFVSKPIWTRRGRVQAFILVFMHIKTRRVVVTRSSTNPDAAWVAEQMAAFADATKDWTERPRMLLRDRDSKFGPGVDESLTAAGIEPLRLPPFSPNLNAFVERFIKTLQVECLDRFIVLGTAHLDHLTCEFVDYYNRQRPHSRIGFRVPAQVKDVRAVEPPVVSPVRCQERLGGVIRHYYRKAA